MAVISGPSRGPAGEQYFDLPCLVRHLRRRFMASEHVIHVVEDDQPMRDSVVMLREGVGYKVRADPRAEDLLALGASIEPGCVVSDVRMPGMDGLALFRHLRSSGLAVGLVLFTGHGDIPMAVAGMKAGAFEFLEKPFEAASLLAAIEGALQTRSNELNAKYAEDARQRLEQLTPREREVLDHLAAGASNKEAAVKIGISPRTVEFHRANIITKTGAKGLPA